MIGINARRAFFRLLWNRAQTAEPPGQRNETNGGHHGYATLLVHLELGKPNTALLKMAGDLAARLKAAVIGIAVCQPMRIIYNDGYIPADVIEQDRMQIDDEIAAAEAEFRAALATRTSTVEWRSGVTYTSLSSNSRRRPVCRLLITGVDQNASLFDTSRHVDIGDLVMQAGRPCLIVPAAAETLPLKHVIVGWKDTGETRRAIRDAVPLLKAAGRVTIVAIAAEEDRQTPALACRMSPAGSPGWYRGTPVGDALDRR